MPGKVAFFLGGAARNIRGGFKVLFIYANFLARQGYAVTIVFPATNANNRDRARIARALRYVAGMLWSGVYLPDAWFDLHPTIETRWVWRSSAAMLHEFDVVIIADHAAGADVLTACAPYRDGGGKLLYLFQEYEYYRIGAESVRNQIETLIRTVDAVIAISPAAREVAAMVRGSCGTYLVCNGVELEHYFLVDPVGDCERKAIGFAFREEAFKRSDDVVAALTVLRSLGVLEGYTCWAYGTRRRPDLPGWIRYHRSPAAAQIRELLNRSAVFVVASLHEGWGLPGAEAMACGAALVTTRNGGCEVYAREGETALLCPPGNVDALVAAVERLLRHPAMAADLAARGHASIQAFTWESACARFLQCLQEIRRDTRRVNTA